MASRTAMDTRKRIDPPRLFACQHCNREFASEELLQRHLSRKGANADQWRRLVVCNQCAWCQQVFSNVLYTRNHVQRWQGHCVARQTRAPNQPELVPPSHLQCPCCDFAAETLDSLQAHICTHAPAGSSSPLVAVVGWGPWAEPVFVHTAADSSPSSASPSSGTSGESVASADAFGGNIVPL